MAITLNEEKTRAIQLALTRLYREEFDEELSVFQAERIMDFFIQHLGPAVYNQGIQDARAFLSARLEDLDAEFYEPEAPL